MHGKGLRKLEICIVGAGVSGLLMGIRLKQAGIDDFVIYEKAGSVGGTWRENTYPGLTCDVPSFFYSFSFAANPDWSHRFSPGPEIREYIEDVAVEHDLMRHIAFNEEVTRAEYTPGRWEIETRSGGSRGFDLLLMASGPLRQRNYPDIKGLGTFSGTQFHSADWDHDVPLEGKRIGVVGNGSTGVQMMEPLSRVASKLTMFQRTPQWIMPVDNKPYSKFERRLTARIPLLGRLTRRAYKLLYDAVSVGVVEDGFMRRQINNGCRKHLASIEDPELRRKLTPDYEPGCKRMIVSKNFYPTLGKDHVELVTEAIDRVEPRGVVTLDGKLHELDILVLSTGFRPHAWGVDPVIGEDGISLKEAWERGTRSYKSIAVPGFPNFFTLVGPNSPIGNISIIDIAETQSLYIMECIRVIREGRASALAPKVEAARKFHAALSGAMEGTVWVTGCSSWYLDEAGTPILWPWSAKRFHTELRTPNFADYDFISA